MHAVSQRKKDNPIGEISSMIPRATTKFPDQIIVARTANTIPWNTLLECFKLILYLLILSKIRFIITSDPFDRGIEVTIFYGREFFLY